MRKTTMRHTLRALYTNVPMHLLALALAGLMTVNSAIAAESGMCKPFPTVNWWKGLSHDKVIRLVDKKYDGDWDRYIAKWERQLAKLEDVQDRGSSVIFRKRGVRLSGDRLAEYIDQVAVRVSVSRCLATKKTKSHSQNS
jgi:hypothetical protein